jgi:hypothetical protein
VVGIDPDGQQGIKKVDKTSVIKFLRGPDTVGSQVVVRVSKHNTKEVVEFPLKRAEYRSVEKIKDLYMKMAALGSAAARYKEDYEKHAAEAKGKPLGTDYLRKVLVESLDDFQAITGELEEVVKNYTDWTGVVEDCLRAHVQQLEQVAVYAYYAPTARMVKPMSAFLLLSQRRFTSLFCVASTDIALRQEYILQSQVESDCSVSNPISS